MRIAVLGDLHLIATFCRYICTWDSRKGTGVIEEQRPRPIELPPVPPGHAPDPRLGPALGVVGAWAD